MKLYEMNHLLTPFAAIQPSATDGDCRLIGADIATGSEDLAVLTGGKVLVTSGDLGKLLFTGDFSPDGELEGRAKQGTMVVIDMFTEVARTVPVKGLPEGVRFQPHGLYFSNATGRGEY